MRARDLGHQELLELGSRDGDIRFAGQRALILDVEAMEVLRSELVESFGPSAAHTLLTQFGFAQGWRMAEAIRSEVRWDGSDEWARAGARIFALHGLFSVEPAEAALDLEDGLTLTRSYEAEQQLALAGPAPAPVCWTVCGLVSGYLSRTHGTEIWVLESTCVGKGDAVCRLVGRTRQGWGQERAHELQFPDRGQLRNSLDISLDRVTRSLGLIKRKLSRRPRARTVPRVEAPTPPGMVAISLPMKRLLSLSAQLARVDSTVLITGESGSGKERIGRLLHDGSPRSAGPFVAINCGAVAEDLLESELFGHARGAFSGATRDRPGLFEAADGGTLFLDEVGEISPGMQVKLLRALQEREVRRVGENQSRRVDVRIVAATNRNLSRAVADSTFRQDLYYRLRVVELRVPALRERRADILVLARILIGEAAALMKRDVTGLDPAAAQLLLDYAWPGNVRELENTMERAVALATGKYVELKDFPLEIREQVAVVGIDDLSPRSLADVKREHLLSVLSANAGNRAETATQLRIGPATLYRRLREYGITSGEGPTQKTVLVKAGRSRDA